MLLLDELTIENIQTELEAISHEMIALIKKYNLSASSQLEIIDMAQNNIKDQKDYIRFLELSLEGRIYGEAVTSIEKENVSK